jgi:hypothetical protein
MTFKQLFKEIYRECPRIVTAIISCAIAAVIMLASLVVNEIVISIQEGQVKQSRIEMYDQAKLREISKAQDAEQWAKDCRAANPIGTDAPANSCDVIQAEPKQEPKSISVIKLMTGSIAPYKELIYELDRSNSNLADIADRLIWRYNASGYSQSPVGLTAEGVDARAKQLLEAYTFDNRFGLTPGYGWELFKKVGNRYGIKPEFLVCIAKADSSLGKSLKTNNNIGNVGNNDRGDRVHLPDIGAGIDHIGKVLTNRYLSYKQSIGSLYPTGGGTAPYYSTSPEGNAYNNVRNCLAEINNNPTVNADWKFRQ